MIQLIINIIAFVFLAIGVFIDLCNLFLSIRSIKWKKSSSIFVVSLICYFCGIIIIRFPFSIWQRILLFVGFLLFHVLCLFVVASIIAKIMGVKYFDKELH